MKRQHLFKSNINIYFIYIFPFQTIDIQRNGYYPSKELFLNTHNIFDKGNKKNNRTQI